MDIQIFQLAYDSGRRQARMGLGPGHLISNGLESFLRERGHAARVSAVEAPEDGFPAEIKTSFDLYRALAGQVRERCAGGVFPLVLSGNCGAAIGAVAGLSGLSPRELGVTWFDAHGDFNTPDTTGSGFLDGMGLATAAGLGWKRLAQTLPGFRPVAPANIAHIGGRDFDPGEEEMLRRHQAGLATGPEVRANGVSAALGPVLDGIKQRVGEIYLHLDLDVLDPVETPANHLSAPDGLSVAETEEAIRMLKERFTIAGMGVASYDPSYDWEGKTLRAAFRLIEAAVG